MPKAEVYGVEFTGTYNNGGFSTYANIAYSVAQGKDWNSAQFLFGPIRALTWPTSKIIGFIWTTTSA